MNKNIYETGREQGFTLIELLVSIFIFALVMSMIYGAYKTVLTSAETVKYGDLPYEQGRSAIERISEDLDGLYVSHEAEFNILKREGKPDPYAVKLERNIYSGKSFSSLKFTSSAHASFSDAGQGVHSEITLYVSQTRDGGYELRRSDKRFPDNSSDRSPRDPVLCRNVTMFEIEAIDLKSQGQGQEQYDSEAGTGFGEIPAAFSVVLESSTGDGKALFKTVVQVEVQRMKNLAEPDNIGGNQVQGDNTEKNEKKESSEPKK